jgi:ribose transport system ATP-binding protein
MEHALTLTNDEGGQSGQIALRLRNVSKSFGQFRALDSVDLDVPAGEVVALLGANGSGKSTLVKVLAGVHAPDPGAEVLLGGRPVRLPILPAESRKLGMSFVFQDLGLALDLTVLENLMIGLRPNGALRDRSYISWRREREQAKRILDSYGIDLDPRTVVSDVAPVGRALLAIARAAEEQKAFRAESGSTCSVLVLDEPTVFLPESDCAFLYDLIRNVTRQGASVILVSHDLDAVREVARSVTVLRNGKVSGHALVEGTTDRQLVDMIVGRHLSSPRLDVGTGQALAAVPSAATQDAGDVALEVRGLRGGRIEELALTVGHGEVLGLAGLLGSGVEELPYLLFGAQPAEAGTVRVGRRALTAGRLTPLTAMRSSIALVPADRAELASVGTLPVEENMLLLVEKHYFRRAWRRRGRIRSRALSRCESFDVRPRDPEMPLGSLSGGNQQKVILAKWLEISPKVILLHEPTQGVDVGAREDVYRLVQEVRARTGACVVWVTTDFAELARVSDRVLIVRNGRVSDELSRAELSREAISHAVFGSAEAGAARQDRTRDHDQAVPQLSDLRSKGR